MEAPIEARSLEPEAWSPGIKAVLEAEAEAVARPGARSPEPGVPGPETTEDRRPKTEDRSPAQGSPGAAMIAHVVLFRPKPELPDAARQRLVDGFTRAIREIPQIRRARIGPRVTHGRPYEQLMRSDYSYAAVLEFDDVESLKAYLAHDAHEALGAAFFECFEEALIYDYELGEAAGELASLLGATR